MTAELLQPGGELVIKDAPPELRIQALETLPVPIELGEVYLTAKGIDRYGGTDENEEVRNEYFRKCREAGIIPISTLTLKTSGDNNSFYPRIQPVEFAIPAGRDEPRTATTESIVQALVRGGKFATIKFDIATNNAFSGFKRDHLRQTLDQGYEIESAELALTTYRISGYNEGTYYGATLLVGPRGIRVNGENRLTEQQIERLKPFFAQLRGQQRLASM